MHPLGGWGSRFTFQVGSTVLSLGSEEFHDLFRYEQLAASRLGPFGAPPLGTGTVPLNDSANPWKTGEFPPNERYALGDSVAWALWEYLDFPSGRDLPGNDASRETFLDSSAVTLQKIWDLELPPRPPEPFDSAIKMPSNASRWLSIVESLAVKGSIEESVVHEAHLWQERNSSAFTDVGHLVTAHRDFLPHNLLVDGETAVALDLERVGSGTTADELVALNSAGWSSANAADNLEGGWWARGLRERLPGLEVSCQQLTLLATIRLLHIVQVQRTDRMNEEISRALTRLLSGEQP